MKEFGSEAIKMWVIKDKTSINLDNVFSITHFKKEVIFSGKDFSEHLAFKSEKEAKKFKDSIDNLMKEKNVLEMM